MSLPLDAETLTPLTDGVDYQEAANVNNLNTKLANLITWILGTGTGAAQSHQSDILSMLKDAYTGGRCYKKDADEIYVGSFKGIITNAAGTVKKLRVIDSVTTLSAANLDTGAFAAATYYYIYATADAAATTPAFVISASASAPTGYTYYRRIGWFYNETINVLDITGGNVSTFIGGDNNEQTVYHQRQDEVTCNTAVPDDNNARTSAEGILCLTKKIIPTSNSYILRIDVSFQYGCNGAYGVAILMNGTIVLAVGRATYHTGGGPTGTSFTCFMTSPGTSGLTINVNIGDAAAAGKLNTGVNAASKDNGKQISSLTITEKKA